MSDTFYINIVIPGVSIKKVMINTLSKVSSVFKLFKQEMEYIYKGIILLAGSPFMSYGVKNNDCIIAIPKTKIKGKSVFGLKDFDKHCFSSSVSREKELTRLVDLRMMRKESSTKLSRKLEKNFLENLNKTTEKEYKSVDTYYVKPNFISNESLPIFWLNSKNPIPMKNEIITSGFVYESECERSVPSDAYCK